MRWRYCMPPSTRTTRNGLIGRFYTRLVFPRRVAARPVSAGHGRPASRFCPRAELGVRRAGRPARRSRWRFWPSWDATIANTVCCQHYETLGRRCTRPCETSWPRPGPTPSTRPPAVAEPITGAMCGAADAEEGPAWWDGTVIEHLRVSRDLAVIRCNWTARCPTTPASTSTSRAAVPAAVAISHPRHPAGSRRRRVPRPRGFGRPGQQRHRQRDPARRPVAAVQPARRLARRPRRRRRADGGG